MCESCHLGHDQQSTGRRRLNLFAAGLIIAAGAAAAALALSSLHGGKAGAAAALPRTASVVELRGRDLRTGRPLAAALRGRAVIVEFWSSACPACRQAASSLQQLVAGDGSRALVGIDVGDTRASAVALVSRLGWRQLSTADPSAGDAAAVGVYALPTTLLLDRRHRIVLQLAGLHGLATLIRRFEQLR